MTTREIKIVKKASFNPDVRKYWLLNGIVICTVTLVGILFIPIWYVIGLWITGRYLARLECILTEKTLIVRKGIWVRTEKTVPLDKNYRPRHDPGAHYARLEYPGSVC